MVEKTTIRALSTLSALFFLNVFLGMGASGMQYSTTFPLTENPLSESGNWLNTRSVGIDWSNAVTTAGLAYGTQTGNEPGNYAYSDSTAILSGSWGPTQTVTATIKITTTDPGTYEEVELRLRSTLTAHANTGYEITYGTVASNPYVTIVRWNGALGDFTYITPVDHSHYVKNGDVVKATMSGSTINMYINGALIQTVNDSTFTSGSPGMGFFLQNAGGAGHNANFGFATFSATDGATNATPRYTLTVVNGTGSGTYNSNTVVNISASIPTGEPFKNWSGSNIANTNSPSTTVIMTGTNLTVTANYVPFPPTGQQVISGP